MLLHLKIKNFLLIDNIEIDFHNKFTVVTGETGSGKSIIIDALSALFNGKGLKDSNQCVIEAIFTISNYSTLQWITDNGLIDSDNNGQVICRRLQEQSRSRIFINGNTVTNVQIKQLGEMMIDIYTQHASINLLKKEVQRNLLDEYANITSNVTSLNTIYKYINDCQQDIENSSLHFKELQQQQHELTMAINDLSGLKLKLGEWEELEQQQQQLSNINIILQELTIIDEILNHQNYNVIKSVNQIKSHLAKIIDYVPQSKQADILLNSIIIELDELNNEINNLVNKNNANPSQLKMVEQRMDAIFTISRKYKKQPNELCTYLDTLNTQLNNLQNNVNLEQLQNKLITLCNQYDSLATTITATRLKVSKELSTQITKYLHKLDIQGTFVIKHNILTTKSAFGYDDIEFYISFNQGMPLAKLQTAISGGELSRSALALYLLLSLKSMPEIIIFDEIDVGISGKTAAIVGQMLRGLGENKQLICITHQPQTASFGHHHLIVSKHLVKQNMKINTDYVTDNSRINEIARMLAGIELTGSAILHAQEMLKHANS
jgi:DNA repair protein RecN (Recombination protein N)